MTLAIDLDVFNVGSTPLQMLLVVLIITVLVGLVIVVVTQIFSPYLNRRWPATAPLSPTELLWGEAGGHVKRTFQGLDLEDQKDLASQLNERKVPAGAPITSQGDPATAFYLLKSGTAEAVQVDASGGERKLRDYAEGDSFGEVAILERSPRTATVRALTDVVVLELPAEDFVAAAAQTAAEGNDFTVVARQFLVADRARARIAAGEPALNPVQQIQQSAPSGAAACAGARQRDRVVRSRDRGSGRRGGCGREPPLLRHRAAVPTHALPPASGGSTARTAGRGSWRRGAARLRRRPRRPTARRVDLLRRTRSSARSKSVRSPRPGGRPAIESGPAALPHAPRPIPNAQPTVTLQAGTLVRLIERSGDWARVDADNGWTGWVDGRHLDPYGP